MYRKNLFAKRILSILLSTLMLVSFAPVAGLADELEEIEVVDFENIAEPEEIPADESTDEPTNEPTDTPTDEPSAPAADEPVDEDESVTTAADAVEGEEPATEPVVVDVSYNSENVYDAIYPFPAVLTFTTNETGTTYQWQEIAIASYSDGAAEGWSDIEGAISNKYTIDTTDFVNIAKVYRCVISNEGTESKTVVFTTLSEDYFSKVKDETITDLKGLQAEILKDKGAAKIGDTYYMTLDEALIAVGDGETITLRKNCETKEGFAIDGISVTIDCAGYELTATTKGIYVKQANAAGVLTFKNGSMELSPAEGTPRISGEAYPWAAIVLNWNCKLIFQGFAVNMNAMGTTNTVCYMHAGASLTENNSSFRAEGFSGNGFSTDDGNYDVTVSLNESKMTLNLNRTGFNSNYVINVKNYSNLTVTNSRGHGSNGADYFVDNHSVVYYDGNGSHGMSARNVVITDESSVTSNNNRYYGVYVNRSGRFQVDSTSNLTTNGNGYAGLRLLPSDHEGLVEAGAKVTINYNKSDGLYNERTTTFAEGSIVEIMYNHDAGKGGGIYNTGVLTMPAKARIYNNHADKGGDDIYSTNIITFKDVGTNWILDDCNHLIDAWYDDSEVSEDAIDSGARYKVHLLDGETEDDLHVVAVDSNTYEGVLAIKAAHNILKPTPITPKAYITINKFDGEGNPLTGASFTVTNADGSSSMGVNMSDVSTKTVGIYEEGTFVVTETVVPEGYTPSAPVTVTVTERDNGTRETAAVVNVYNTKAGDQPTAEPTAAPTGAPTTEPTAAPEPTAEPTAAPEPTAEPTAAPEPTEKPTARPTAAPTDDGGESDVPKTGDSFPVEAVSLVLASLVALACIVILMRRRIGRA